MRPNLALRAITLVLAGIHTFPAIRHIGLFVDDPSAGEAWKGFGAAFAVALYLLPPSIQRRGLVYLWNERRNVLVIAGWALAVGHAVPASDHLPRFFMNPTWGDAWRGFGSALALAWFLLPLPKQAAMLRALCEGSRKLLATSRRRTAFISNRI